MADLIRSGRGPRRFTKGRLFLAFLSIVGASVVAEGHAEAAPSVVAVQASVLESAIFRVTTSDRSEFRWAMVAAYTSPADSRVLVQICTTIPLPPHGLGLDGPADDCNNYESPLGTGELIAKTNGTLAHLTTTVPSLGEVDLQFFAPTVYGGEGDCEAPVVRSSVVAFGVVVNGAAVTRAGHVGPFVVDGSHCGLSGTNLATVITML